MYQFLKDIDQGINLRYLTVMRNIRSASNSFYDSYLDLLEETIKTIADNLGYEYDSNITCGQLVKKPEIKSIIINQLGIDEHTYGKFSDYSQKINKHKHHLEKNVNVDVVLNYMKVFDELIVKYSSYLGRNIIDPLDSNYISLEFGKAEKENKELKEEADLLKNELELAAKEKQLSEKSIIELKKLIAEKDENNVDLEEENFNLVMKINKLKDIKLNSLETKLDKTLDILGELQDYLAESRIATAHVYKAITGYVLTDERLEAERLKLRDLIKKK